jgi:hypothetical protein
MIDFETAKRRIIETWLPICGEDLMTPAVLLDDKTEEHAWGWVFYWAPADPSKVPENEAKWGYHPLLVDRTNGNVHPVGTAGMKIAIAQLLWDRESPS